MAEKNNLIEQMLEHLVNDDQQKAEDLFHEYVVAKSREIYEGLIESEMAEATDEEDEEEVEEAFGEAGDDEFGGDATDDLEGDLEMGDDEFGGEEEEAEKGEEELFQDLDDIVDQLQSKFDELKGIEQGEHGDEFGSDEGDDEMKDDFDLETVREYVEKVPAGHGAEKKGQAEKADGSATGLKFSKNDMGGQSLKFGQEAREAGKGTAGGLANNKAQDMKTGNINVPGGKAGSAFSKKEPGHGAEKKGAAEGSTDGQSLFRGRR